jgi:DNA-binding NtrC family response regulator
MRDDLMRFAPSSAPVLIIGEAGSGKMECAKMLHAMSPKFKHPFWHIPCKNHAPASIFSGLPAEIVAQGGSLFISDVCDLTWPKQAELLRFLQSGVLGDANTLDRDVDLRIFCGSAHNLETAVEQGHLREDLFYRLNVVSLKMPIFPKDANQILALFERWLQQDIDAPTRRPLALGQSAKEAIIKYHWPGHAHEMAALALAVRAERTSGILKFADFPKDFQHALATQTGSSLRKDMPNGVSSVSADERLALDAVESSVQVLVRQEVSLAEVEKALVKTAIAFHNGSIPQAANHLGLAPSTLYRKLSAWER